MRKNNNFKKKKPNSVTAKTQNNSYFIYGTHAALSALRNPKRIIETIYLTYQYHEKLLANPLYSEILKNYDDRVRIINNTQFEKILPDNAVHQNIALFVKKLENMNLSHFLKNSQKELESPHHPASSMPRIVIMDQIQDPHNFGAILRSMYAFNFQHVILSKANSVEENSIVAKTASGYLEHINIIYVTNISDTIKMLQKYHYWCLGLDGAGNNDIDLCAKLKNIALVIGSEGVGLRSLTKTNCDELVSIKTNKEVESLNASNAIAIALYEIDKISATTE